MPPQPTPASLLRLAHLHTREKRKDLATQSVSQALRLDPDHPEALRWLAQTALENHQLEEALTFLLDSLKRDPAHLPSFHQIGHILLMQGKPSEALPFLQSAAPQLSPPLRAKAFEDLAETLSLLHRWKEAAQAFSLALPDHPNPIPLLQKHSHALLQAHLPDEAEHCLRHGLSLFPEDPDLTLALAKLLLQKGRLPEAQALSEQLDPVRSSRAQLLRNAQNAIAQIAPLDLEFAHSFALRDASQIPLAIPNGSRLMRVWRTLFATLQPHYSHLLFVPSLAHTPVSTAALSLLHLFQRSHGPQSTLLVVSDQNLLLSELLPPNTPVLNLPALSQDLSSLQRIELVFSLVQTLQPAHVHNVSSLLLWEAFQIFGPALHLRSRLSASLFAEDFNPEAFATDAAPPGLALSHLPKCLPFLHAITLDSLPLKHALLHHLALPESLASRLLPVGELSPEALAASLFAPSPTP
ncbi:MAG: hypothetical protein RLZZ244_2671 [Verrucomicrobiota bacterium]